MAGRMRPPSSGVLLRAKSVKIGTVWRGRILFSRPDPCCLPFGSIPKHTCNGCELSIGPKVCLSFRSKRFRRQPPSSAELVLPEPRV